MSPPAVEIEVMKKSTPTGNNFNDLMGISLEILIPVLIANNIKKNGFCQTQRRTTKYTKPNSGY